MMNSTRVADMQSEARISAWLADVLKRIFGKTNITLQTGKAMQCAGVDITALTSEGRWHIDAKVQASPRYLNHPTETFSQELEFTNRRGERQVGWAMNSDLLTTHYLFGWVHVCKVPEGAYCMHPAQEIGNIELMLVEKTKLHELFPKPATLLAYQYILEDESEDELERTGKYPDRVRHEFSADARLVLTNNLAERPLNLVCSKRLLARAAVMHFSVIDGDIVHHDAVDEAVA